MRESRGRCMSRGRCRKIWVPLVYFMCWVRGRSRGSRLPCYLCYRAVHCWDSRSEDSILESLLHRSSRNLLGHLRLEGPGVRVRRGHCCRRHHCHHHCCWRVVPLLLLLPLQPLQCQVQFLLQLLSLISEPVFFTAISSRAGGGCGGGWVVFIPLPGGCGALLGSWAQAMPAEFSSLNEQSIQHSARISLSFVELTPFEWIKVAETWLLFSFLKTSIRSFCCSTAH